MFVIVTGSRTIPSQMSEQAAFIWGILSLAPEGSTIVNGKAKGADLISSEYANANKINLIEFPANWRPNGTYDKAAGIKRNRYMVDEIIKACDPDEFGPDGKPLPPDLSNIRVLAFTDKPLIESRGTRDCVTYALDKGITVYHYRTDLKQKMELS